MVKIGLVQMKCVEDKQANVDKAIEKIGEAVDQGAKIVCLQELFNGIYFPQYLDNKFFSLYPESVPGGESIVKMQEVAEENSIVLVVPVWEEAEKGVYYNTAAVIDANGEYLGKYRKTHIPHLAQYQEKYYFTPGDLGYPVFETKYGRVGIAICYDRHFPECFRSLALGGAEIVFVPTATAGWTRYLWDLEIRGHAVANMFYVAGLNRVGQEGDMEFYGSSYIADPKGQYVEDKQASDTEEEVLVVDCDFDQIAEVRKMWHFFRDRRPSMYKKICSYPALP